MDNYFRNRKQRVVLNGSFADYSLVNSGVPQGSAIGSLLFLININDLENNIKSNVKFFAGDTVLFSIIKDPTTSADEFNYGIQTISQWAHHWKLEFNPDPSRQATELLFSQKKYRTYQPPLLFNGNEVSKVNERKYLSLILDTKLSFEKHNNEKIIKAKKIIGITKHLSNYLPIKTIDLISATTFRLLSYNLPSLTNESLNSLMEKMEKP